MSEGVCSVSEGGWRRYRLRIPDLDGQTHHWLSPRNTLHHARPERQIKPGEYVLIHPDGHVMDATEQNAQIIEDWYMTKDRLCSCSVGDTCPLGKAGSQTRCGADELRDAMNHQMATQVTCTSFEPNVHGPQEKMTQGLNEEWIGITFCSTCDQYVKGDVCPNCHNAVNAIVKEPPLGIAPSWLVDERRVREIAEAVIRYVDDGKPVPSEWLHELVWRNERAQTRDKTNA